MFDPSQINFANILYEILKTVLTTIATALITYLIINKYHKSHEFAKKMKEFGFDRTVAIEQIDYKKIFQKAEVIKMMYVSAVGFFRDEKKKALIEAAANRGAKMQFLFAQKGSEFLEDIMEIERVYGMRTKDADINREIDEVFDCINNIKANCPSAKIEVKYYSSEYRMPIVIAQYDEGNKTDGYLNITFPPLRSKDHILLNGTADKDEMENADEHKRNIVKMLNDHFDSVWAMSSTLKDPVDMSSHVDCFLK